MPQLNRPNGKLPKHQAVGKTNKQTNREKKEAKKQETERAIVALKRSNIRY